MIGNGGYEGEAALPGCPAAARTVAATLRDLGFETQQVMDATNGEMSAALQRTSRQLQPGALAIAYFCGRGVSFQDRGFLVPIGARTDQPTRILTEGIVATSLVGLIDRAKPKAGIVILDVAGDMAEPDAELAAGRTAAFPLPSPPAPVVTAVAATAAPAAPGAFTTALVANLREAPADLYAALAKAGQQATGETTAVVLSPPPGDRIDLRRPAPAAGVSAGAVTEAATAAVPDTVPPSSGPPSPPSEAAAPSPRDSVPATDFVVRLSPDERRRAQMRLQALGHYGGPIDGIFGRETQAAIRRFQTGAGAPATGELTASQATRLLSGTAADAPAR